MESDKLQKRVAGALIALGGMTFVLSDFLLEGSGARDIVKGAGTGICVIGGIMAVLLWRDSRSQ